MSKNSTIIKNSNKIYDKSSKEYGLSSQAVLWGDQQTQYLRFKEILNFIPLSENISILDVGCGNAEFYKFLNFNGFIGSYTGFDINENLLAQSRENYKDIVVEKRDILEDTIEEKFDYVIVSGLFNCNYGQDMKWTLEMIKALDKLANTKVIFNAISSYVNFKNDTAFYIDPKEITDFILKNISTNMTLVHGALPYNFTIAINKSKPWTSINI